MMDYIKLSESGAKKICGQAGCIACYPCGHTNKATTYGLDLLNKDHTVCPLAKYNVPEEKNAKPWNERPYEETTPTDDEMFALCARCDNTDGIELCGDHIEVNPKDAMLCMDCPVYIVRESIAETEAEIRMG